MEGPEKFQRFVVIEFPTFEQGVACFTSDEYNKAAAFRRSGAGEVETVILDGFEPDVDELVRSIKSALLTVLLNARRAQAGQGRVGRWNIARRGIPRR